MTAEDLEKSVAAIVDHYCAKAAIFEAFEKQVRGVAEHSALTPHIHSLKTRIKDPEHLRDKLRRKAHAALSGGPAFDITPDNLPTKINDLVGVRLIHLHTSQIDQIHPLLLSIFKETDLGLIENFARTWDLESKQRFETLGISTEDSPSFYTSVHYIVSTMNPAHPRTAEFQVRSLAEEIWGEVDHTINYPVRTSVLSCREQLKVLARLTSSCSRLVDSIFATYQESVGAAAAPQADKNE
jgi:ppGpp synthetase/RelA/SpoT-type nucleotidyltranferase